MHCFMMNVSELMVGDWMVRESHKDTPQQVIGIAEHGVTLKLEGGWRVESIDLVEPIPLTHEVVAQVAKPSANGYWELTPSLYIEGNTLWCTLEPKSEMITHYRDDLEYLDFLSKETFYEKVCDINYVHELQHILKTLHIDKEIQL